MIKKILAILICLLSLTGCKDYEKVDNYTNNEVVEQDADNNELKDYHEKILNEYEEKLSLKYNLKYDNEKKLESIDKEYELEELIDFLGKGQGADHSLFKDSNYKDIGIEELNERFPIKILRIRDYSVYSVYKIKGGGYLYIEFTLAWKEMNFTSEEEMFENAMIVYDRYTYIESIESLPSESDFTSIVKNKSTYLDVLNISKNTDFILHSGTNSCSYTLLKNGKLLEIEYEYKSNDSDNERKNEIVVSKKVIDDYDIYLRDIYKYDLPEKHKK